MLSFEKSFVRGARESYCVTKPYFMRKRVLTLAIIVSFTTTLLALKPATIDLNKKWGNVIEAIEQVESEGKEDAVSRNGRYVGCLQISEILVRQCNLIVGYDKYTYDDRLDREKSHEMFIVYQEYYNKDGNMELAIRLWNSGDLQCMKRKARTEGYYRRVMNQYRQMAKN